MLMKRILAFIVVLMPLIASAQSFRVVRGSVYDTDGMPLTRAEVSYPNMTDKLKLGNDGSFQLDVPHYVKNLTATCEGYIPMTLEIDGSHLIFKLKVDKKYQENKAKAEAQAHAEAEARLKAEKEAAEKAAAKEKADQEAAAKAAEKAAAKEKAEQEAAAKAAEKAKAQAEAKAKAEKEAAEKAQAKAEAKARSEQEAAAKSRLKVETDAKAQVTEMTKKVSNDAKKSEALAKKQAKQAYKAEYNELYRNKGLVHHVELNYTAAANKLFDPGFRYQIAYENLGVREYNLLHPIQLTYTLSYRFNNYASVGLGLGINYELVDLRSDDSFAHDMVENYIAAREYSNIQIPVFVDGKFYLTQTKFQPMVSLSAGMYLSRDYEVFENSMLFDLGIGCNIRLNKKQSFYVMPSVCIARDFTSFVDSHYCGAYRESWIGLRLKIGVTL
jgi:hypothetical protein